MTNSSSINLFKHQDYDQYEYQKSDSYWDFQSSSGSHEEYYYDDNCYAYQYNCDNIERQAKVSMDQQSVLKSEPQEMSETSSEALYLDNLEITDARDILDLETPIKIDKHNDYDNDFDFHDTLWQQFNGQSSDQTSEQTTGQSCEAYVNGQESCQQNLDLSQTEEYIVTCLDDLQPIDRESQQLAYSIGEWPNYNNQQSIFNSNTTDIVFDGSQNISESDYQTFSDNCYKVVQKSL